MKLQILLLMLPLAFARLSVRVDVSKNVEDVNVELLGEDDHVIDDDETNTFRLTEEPLKDAVERYFGARPTDAFLHSSTPWGDLYQRYGWSQVHRVLKPIKVTILGMHSQPEIIATQKFTNNSTKKADYNGQISHSVTNTVTNSWNSGHSINVEQEINYEFNLLIGTVGGKTSFSYSHEWGKSGSQDEAVTLTATGGLTVSVAPGETVMTSLTASRGTMELEVTYEASLYGAVAVNYYYTHQGHHFWGLDVEEVMRAGNLPQTIRRSEIIQIGFYSDVDILLNERNGRTRSLRSKVLVS